VFFLCNSSCDAHAIRDDEQPQISILFPDFAGVIMPETVRKGIFIPAWVIACIFSPIIAGGVGAITWTAKTLVEHSHQLIEIDEKLDSNKELLIEMVNSHERRISRIEDRVFGEN
jgi:hypothetical protein